MTDGEKLQRILDALPELLEGQRRMSETLDALTRAAAPAPAPASADDLVDVEYFARASGLSRITIRQGKAGTDKVQRASKRPSRWRKGDVDRWVRERASALRPPRQKALKLLERRRA